MSAFDYSVRQITTSDSTVAGDHMRCVEIAPTVTTAVTIALGDATTMTSVYRVFIKNSSLLAQTVARVTAGDTIDGATGNLTLPARSGVILQTNAAATGYLTVSAGSPLGTSIPRSYLSGLGLSTAGASTTMTTAVGQATDSTNVSVMSLAAATGKTTSAWAVGSGNGGLDTGAIATSTWYHFHLIQRLDTGVVDVLFSLSATSPTLPTNYTLFRRIGSGKTNGSSQWTSFSQKGDSFLWAAKVLDLNAVSPNTTSANTATLTVPTGVQVDATVNWVLGGGGTSNNSMYVSAFDETDEAVSTTAAPLFQVNTYNIGLGLNPGPLTTRTNTSAQVRYRLLNGVAATTVSAATVGWVDRRGRDS